MPAPSRPKDKAEVLDQANGSVQLKYRPTVAGTHEVDLFANGKPAGGSPYVFHVDKQGADGFITAYGTGLSSGTAGEPTTFTIYAKAGGSLLGPGGINVVIDGPAKPEIKLHDNKDGTISVNWLPPAGGDYQVHVKHADKDIHGSPFKAAVFGVNRKRAQMSVGSTCEVSIKAGVSDLKGVGASIKTPRGIEEPCFVRGIDKDHIGVGFTPREAGEHQVSIKKNGTLVPGAPFKIRVDAKDVGNAEKVVVSGDATKSGKTQAFNEFKVDTRPGGFGGMSVGMEGPSRCELNVVENDDKTHTIGYKPYEPGVYVLNVKFADKHVPGSPFTIRAEGAGVGTVTETLTKPLGPAPPAASNQAPVEFLVRVPNSSPMDMSAYVLDMESKKEDLEIRDIKNANYQIMFTPLDDGVHTMCVLHKDMHVAGSPFPFTVGMLKDGGAHRLRVGGPGLVRGEVGLANSFNLYWHETGGGTATINVEGPSKAHIEWHQLQDGMAYVTWQVAKQGRYIVSIKWNNQHIHESPWKIDVAAESSAAKKLTVTQMPSGPLQEGQPSTFMVKFNGSKGHLEAKSVGPSGVVEDCFISPIEDNEAYYVRVVPHEPGNHYVSVLLDGVHMPDSPFRMRVGGADEADPTNVKASGDGLESGETGQKLEFFINTCNAGVGHLGVSCDGPSKVMMEAYDVDVGYKVRYTPLAPGDYIIAIKYNGVHIPASPFRVPISGQVLGGSGIMESASLHVDTVAKTPQQGANVPVLKGEANKVEVTGNGVKKMFAGRANTFRVDTSKAGANLLSIAVLSKTELAPAGEVTCKHAFYFDVGFGRFGGRTCERGVDVFGCIAALRWQRGNVHFRFSGAPLCYVCPFGQGKDWRY